MLNKDKKKFLIVYRITNLLNGKIYIGAHTTYNINDKYMGSSKSLKKDIKELGRENFKKDILFECSSKEEMMKKEGELVTREFCHRSDTYNRHVGGSDNFTMEDMITVVNPEGGYMKVYNDDPRWLSGELKSMMKNTIVVKNKDGNVIRIDNDDPRWLSGELLGVTKGHINVKDKNNNILNINTDDPRYISGELVALRKGSKGHPNQSFLGMHHSDETKKKMSDKNKGKKNSDEHKEKISAALKKWHPRVNYDNLKKGVKYCPKCKETKILKEFNKSKRTKDGHTTPCKQCRNIKK